MVLGGVDLNGLARIITGLTGPPAGANSEVPMRRRVRRGRVRRRWQRPPSLRRGGAVAIERSGVDEGGLVVGGDSQVVQAAGGVHARLRTPRMAVRRRVVGGLWSPTANRRQPWHSLQPRQTLMARRRRQRDDAWLAPPQRQSRTADRITPGASPFDACNERHRGKCGPGRSPARPGVSRRWHGSPSLGSRAGALEKVPDDGGVLVDGELTA